MLKYYAGAWKIFNSWGHRPTKTLKDSVNRLLETISYTLVFCSLFFIFARIVAIFILNFFVLFLELEKDTVADLFAFNPGHFIIAICSMIAAFPFAVFLTEKGLNHYFKESTK